MAKLIKFWFSIGSTYTYLSVNRMKEVQERNGISCSWQPFSVRKIMKDMDNIPFPPNKKPKVDYMWRDIQRRAEGHGFEAKVPVPYPLKEFDLANRIAVLGMQEGWCEHYVRTTYRRWFQEGLEPGIEPNVSDSLREIGQNPTTVLRLAAEGKNAVRRRYQGPCLNNVFKSFS